MPPPGYSIRDLARADLEKLLLADPLSGLAGLAAEQRAELERRFTQRGAWMEVVRAAAIVLRSAPGPVQWNEPDGTTRLPGLPSQGAVEDVDLHDVEAAWEDFAEMVYIAWQTRQDAVEAIQRGVELEVEHGVTCEYLVDPDKNGCAAACLERGRVVLSLAELVQRLPPYSSRCRCWVSARPWGEAKGRSPADGPRPAAARRLGPGLMDGREGHPGPKPTPAGPRRAEMGGGRSALPRVPSRDATGVSARGDAGGSAVELHEDPAPPGSGTSTVLVVVAALVLVMFIAALLGAAGLLG